jgi:hypothetical protein
MKQHPVPQNISSYEFHLIGDMTLKQFGFLVLGGAIALLFYISNANFLIKTAGILSGLLFGAGLAFLAIQERPLDRWILNFFKAIYSPTQYLWKKSKKIPDYFITSPPSFARIQETFFQDKSKQKVPLGEYLQSLPQSPQALTQAEKSESQRLEQISRFLQAPFSSISPVSFAPPPEIQKGNLKIRPLSQKPKVIKIITTPSPIKTAKTEPSPLKTSAQQLKTPPQRLKPLPRPQKSQKPIVQAVSKHTLPFPEKPTIPNIIVGMVKNKEGKIVENAILEIRDEKEIPQRAFKTNKLGQFRIATPLKNGTYSILIEKDELNFDIIKITLNGKLVPPIEIQAK